MKDDVISRQAAIDGFWSLDAELRPSAIDAILNMLNGLPSAQPEQRWIPCSERLPEHNQRIIAYYPEIKSIMVINYNAHGFTSMSAWMPLPEPYAERREE